jgi:hypothetical protein
MSPPKEDMLLDDAFRSRGGRPSTLPQEGTALNPRSDGRDFLDAIESFDRIPLATRPVFFDGSEEEELVSPHTTHDDL